MINWIDPKMKQEILNYFLRLNDTNYILRQISKL